MAQITKDTLIIDIMQMAPQSMPLFRAVGMHCMGCAMARGETVEQACNAHGVNVDELIAKINETVEGN